jgi:hypothetical protein
MAVKIAMKVNSTTERNKPASKWRTERPSGLRIAKTRSQKSRNTIAATQPENHALMPDESAIS